MSNNNPPSPIQPTSKEQPPGNTSSIEYLNQQSIARSITQQGPQQSYHSTRSVVTLSPSNIAPISCLQTVKQSRYQKHGIPQGHVANTSSWREASDSLSLFSIIIDKISSIIDTRRLFIREQQTLRRLSGSQIIDRKCNGES